MTIRLTILTLLLCGCVSQPAPKPKAALHNPVPVLATTAPPASVKSAIIGKRGNPKPVTQVILAWNEQTPNCLFTIWGATNLFSPKFIVGTTTNWTNGSSAYEVSNAFPCEFFRVSAKIE